MTKIESIQASIGLTVKGSTSAEGKTAGQMFSATLANALGSTPKVAMALPRLCCTNARVTPELRLG